MTYTTRKHLLFREKPRFIHCLRAGLTAAMASILALATPAAASSPRPKTENYVSARADWHYLAAVQAWTGADLASAQKSIKLALVYDTQASLLLARAAQLNFVLNQGARLTKLRRSLGRAPGEPMLLRLIAMEKWRLGWLASSKKTFQAASRAAQRLDNPMLTTIIHRDLSLLMAQKESTAKALEALAVHAASDPQLRAWKWQLMAFEAAAPNADCDAEVDGEHSCAPRDDFASAASKSKSMMSFKESCNIGLSVLYWARDCKETNKAIACQRFEQSLRSLAQPIAALEKRNEF